MSSEGSRAGGEGTPPTSSDTQGPQERNASERNASELTDEKLDEVAGGLLPFAIRLRTSELYRSGYGLLGAGTDWALDHNPLGHEAPRRAAST
jgi:hypothetical protein